MVEISEPSCIKCRYGVDHPFHDDGEINETHHVCLGPGCEVPVPSAGLTCSHNCYSLWFMQFERIGGYKRLLGLDPDTEVPVPLQEQSWFERSVRDG